MQTAPHISTKQNSDLPHANCHRVCDVNISKSSKLIKTCQIYSRLIKFKKGEQK